MFDTVASYTQNKSAQQSMQHIAIDSIQQRLLPNPSLQDKSVLKIFNFTGYSTVTHQLNNRIPIESLIRHFYAKELSSAYQWEQ